MGTAAGRAATAAAIAGGWARWREGPDHGRHVSKQRAQSIVACAATTPPVLRTMLLEGQDEIGLTLARRPEIDTFRAQDRQARPWAYALGIGS